MPIKPIKNEDNKIAIKKTNAISSLTNKIINKKEWTDILWEWADTNGIGEKYLPRTKDKLSKLEYFEVLNQDILTKSNTSNSNFAEDIFNKSKQVKKPFELINEVFELTNLKHLDIYMKDMKILPSNISRLDKLTELSLFGNRISAIPKSITKLKYLTTLDLSFNKLKELPDSTCQMTQLKVLKLTSNLLEKLPNNIYNLSNLKSLCIDCCYITELPDTIVLLKQLEVLDLDCNKFSLTKEQENWIETLKQNGCEVSYDDEE